MQMFSLASWHMERKRVCLVLFSVSLIRTYFLQCPDPRAHYFSHAGLLQGHFPSVRFSREEVLELFQSPGIFSGRFLVKCPLLGTSFL